jgi:hypothetical protein
LPTAHAIIPPTHHMKHNVSLITGALLIAAAAGSYAQTAVTDPVGYITMNVTGTANPAAPAISYVGASLVNAVQYAGTAVGGAGTTATFAAASFTVDAFGLNSLNEGKFYVEITSGPNAGVWTDIRDNDATTLTLLDSIGAQINGQTVKIRQHHTVSSLFGDGVANPLKLQGGADTSAADILELISPAGTTQIFFNTDENSWVAGANLVNDKVIAPGEGIKIRRRGVTTPIVLVGHVKTGQTVLPIEQGTNLIAVPRAVGSAFTFGGTGTSNSNLLGSGLTGAADTSAADVISQLTGVTLNQIFYNTDEGAFFTGATNADNFPIPEGTALRIQRRGPAFNWKVPAEIIAP